MQQNDSPALRTFSVKWHSPRLTNRINGLTQVGSGVMELPQPDPAGSFAVGTSYRAALTFAPYFGIPKRASECLMPWHVLDSSSSHGYAIASMSPGGALFESTTRPFLDGMNLSASPHPGRSDPSTAVTVIVVREAPNILWQSSTAQAEGMREFNTSTFCACASRS